MNAGGERLVLGAAHAGLRYDRAVAEVLRADGLAVSAREVRRALLEGQLLVAGRRVRPGDPCAGGEAIGFAGFVPRVEAEIGPSSVPLRIVFEDAFLLVVDKPSGPPTLPLRTGERDTLLGAAVAHAPEIAEGPPLEGGAVHRLDSGTSGLVLFAKDADTRASLRAAFGHHEVEKRYLAVVPAGLSAPIEIDAPLLGSGARVRVDAAGAAARSRVSRVEAHGTRALVEVEARTGRRHQVRVHLAHAGAPIFGDALYGPPGPRLMLHASVVVLPDGRRFEAVLPPEMEAFWLAG